MVGLGLFALGSAVMVQLRAAVVGLVVAAAMGAQLSLQGGGSSIAMNGARLTAACSDSDAASVAFFDTTNFSTAREATTCVTMCLFF